MRKIGDYGEIVKRIERGEKGAAIRLLKEIESDIVQLQEAIEYADVIGREVSEDELRLLQRLNDAREKLTSMFDAALAQA